VWVGSSCIYHFSEDVQQQYLKYGKHTATLGYILRKRLHQLRTAILNDTFTFDDFKVIDDFENEEEELLKVVDEALDIFSNKKLYADYNYIFIDYNDDDNFIYDDSESSDSRSSNSESPQSPRHQHYNEIDDDQLDDLMDDIRRHEQNGKKKRRLHTVVSDNFIVDDDDSSSYGLSSSQQIDEDESIRTRIANLFSVMAKKMGDNDELQLLQQKRVAQKEIAVLRTTHPQLIKEFFSI
jgi:hypothetical protein